MPSMAEEDIIRARFESLQKKSIALDKERVKISERQQAIDTELEGLKPVMAYLEAWLTELGGSAPRAKSEVPKREGPSIRAIVKNLLNMGERWTSTSIVEEVRKQAPDAKPDSIRAEVSHCKTRGELVVFVPGPVPVYKSTLYQQEVRVNEPGPNFGNIASDIREPQTREFARS